MPTGTLANHLAVRELASGPGRAVVQAESHLYNDSGDCVQTLSNMPLVALGPNQASFSIEQLETAVERADTGRVATPIRVISIETPIRRRFGETFDANELERVVSFARTAPLDYARVFERHRPGGWVGSSGLIYLLYIETCVHLTMSLPDNNLGSCYIFSSVSTKGFKWVPRNYLIQRHAKFDGGVSSQMLVW